MSGVKHGDPETSGHLKMEGGEWWRSEGANMVGHVVTERVGSTAG